MILSVSGCKKLNIVKSRKCWNCFHRKHRPAYIQSKGTTYCMYSVKIVPQKSNKIYFLQI